MNRGTLYRSRNKGKIAGVCAGLAEYFSIEVWLIRVVAVSVFLLGGTGLVLVLYVALWMILDVKPENLNTEEHEVHIKKNIWQSGESPKSALYDLSQQFRLMERKLQRLEVHVTSDEFELKRQINNL